MLARSSKVISEISSFTGALKELGGDMKCLLSEDQNGIIFLERIVEKIKTIQKRMASFQKTLEEFQLILEKQIADKKEMKRKK